DQCAHRKRPRPHRTPEPLSDRGNDRSARHSPMDLRVGGERISHRHPACAPYAESDPIQALVDLVLLVGSKAAKVDSRNAGRWRNQRLIGMKMNEKEQSNNRTKS